ncbi:hypothetical protein ABZY83_07240 [Streptomyces virginiae]|nr:MULTISPECIES: hypothetical protein [unclassified Streptomyces]
MLSNIPGDGGSTCGRFTLAGVEAQVRAEPGAPAEPVVVVTVREDAG